MGEAIICPVDFVKVNESQSRLVAGQVVLLSFIYLLSLWWPILLFLTIDFFLRGFKLGKYSPLNIVAKAIVKKFYITGKQVDQAPKRFAAKLGFIFSLLILILHLVGLSVLSFGVTIVLILLAILESVFGYCVGCQIYNLGLKMGLIKIIFN